MPFQGVPEGAAVVRGIVRERTVHPGRHPSTTYVIDVEEALAGQAPSSISLRLPGAVLDGVRMQVDLVPVWHPGDDVVATWLTDRAPPLWAQFTVVGEQLEPIREGAPATVAALEEALEAHR
jgi:hypothetical protein